MRDSDWRYPLPAAPPPSDWGNWRAILLAAIEQELARAEVWDESDVDQALEFVQALIVYVAELEVLPVGMIVPYAGSSAPPGWLLCDGSAVSRTTYAELFATTGTAYGAGDGVSTFNLPDLRRRSAIGAGGDWQLGQQVGAETHTLTVAEMPAHAHNQRGNMLGTMHHGASGGSAARDTLQQTTITAFSGSLLTTATAGGGQAHNNVGPSLVMNWIIKY